MTHGKGYMRVENKFFQITLIVLISLIFLVSCSISTPTPSMGASEDNAYLTPVLESTLSAYREKWPITTKLDAVINASEYIYSTRMTFTQGPPKVIFTEEMTLVEAKRIVPKNPGLVYSHEDRPDDTKVWLVIFEGSWQIYPPDGDLLPLESGCIYAIIDANQSARNQGGTGICQKIP
jgi:hypothetical protein